MKIIIETQNQLLSQQLIQLCQRYLNDVLSHPFLIHDCITGADYQYPESLTRRYD